MQAKQNGNTLNNRLRKSLLSNILSQQTRISLSTCKKMVNSLVKILSDQVILGKSIQIPNFITLEVITKKSRIGTNPQNGNTILIPESKTLKVRASSRLRKCLNGSKSSTKSNSNNI